MNESNKLWIGYRNVQRNKNGTFKVSNELLFEMEFFVCADVKILTGLNNMYNRCTAPFLSLVSFLLLQLI